MDKLDKILLYKCERDIDSLNDVFLIIRNLENYLIVKKYDTCTREEKGLSALSKEEVKENFYTAKEFFKNSKYVGKSGYYKGMIDIEKYISSTQVIIYKDEYNEIKYDIPMGTIFVSGTLYDEKDFIPFEEQPATVRFKKGLSKK